MSSSAVTAGGNKWVLDFYPKGLASLNHPHIFLTVIQSQILRRYVMPEHASLYLNVANAETLPSDWSHPTRFPHSCRFHLPVLSGVAFVLHVSRRLVHAPQHPLSPVDDPTSSRWMSAEGAPGPVGAICSASAEDSQRRVTAQKPRIEPLMRNATSAQPLC